MVAEIAHGHVIAGVFQTAFLTNNLELRFLKLNSLKVEIEFPES